MLQASRRADLTEKALGAERGRDLLWSTLSATNRSCLRSRAR
jgi:hypothetical protein